MTHFSVRSSVRVYGAVRELDPSVTQEDQFRRFVGANRFAQNWALGHVKDCLTQGTVISWSAYSLYAEFLKVREDVCPWYREVSVRSLESGVERCAKALANWKKNKKHFGFPRFRKRGFADSCKLKPVLVRDGAVFIARVGWVALKENYVLPPGARFTGCVLRERAGRWWVTFLVREDGWVPPVKRHPVRKVGVDLGVGDHLAILSSGEKIVNPRYLRKAEALLVRRNRQYSRKRRGSANKSKAARALGRLHFRVACKRKDFLHKLTTHLVETQDLIVVETLNIRGMQAGLRLGKSVSDAALAELVRQLEYKCDWYGVTLIKADPWFPSSKLCSSCNSKNNDLQLGEREWVCASCGARHDRDVNAAQNLLSLAGSSPATACGRYEVLDSPVEAGTGTPVFAAAL